MCGWPSYQVPGAQRVVLEPRARAVPSERDLLPTEAPSQYFQLWPTRSSWKPATCLTGPCPRAVGTRLGRGRAGSQRPHQCSPGVSTPPTCCLLRERQESSNENSLSLSSSSFLSWLLCNYYVIKDTQHLGDAISSTFQYLIM